jgi:peptide/nickel transport system substrate-binding protein
LAGYLRRLALGGLLLSLALAGCGGGEGKSASSAAEAVPEAQRYGGTVVIGGYGDLQGMNSLTAADNNSSSIQREMLFMPLVRYDAKLNPTPWLAESWDTVRVAPDSIDLTFHIRRDIHWHDGPSTTAADVLFTFERAIDPETAFPNISGFEKYSPHAVVLDPYTIRFRLRPHSDFLDAWYQMAIMPEHLLAKVRPSELIRDPFGTAHPVGNGPFRFVRRLPGQEWVFEANPDFTKALGGRPYLDRVVYRVVPEMTTLLTELITGTVDVYLGPNPNQAAQIKATPGVRLNAAPFRQWTYLALNTRRPMFHDARVRRAIAMGLNRQEIVDALLYGYGTVGRSPVTPAHWSFDASDPETLLPYDTTKARALLTEAGWLDRDGNGVLEDPQGHEFRFTVVTNAGNDVRRDMLEIIEAQLRKLGIVAQPRLMEWNTMNSQLQSRARNFDAVVSAWVDYFRKDDRDILYSAYIDKPFQYVGFSNRRVDELIDTLGVMMDHEQARPLWREYQHLMVQEAPYIPLYYPQLLTGVSRKLQGVVIDIRGEFPEIRHWWIPPSQRGGAPATAADSGAGK